MILTKKALEAINNKKVRLELALKLNFTEQWIIKLIDANAENGPLTTHSAILVIQEHTKLKQIKEILTEKVAA